MSSLYNPVKILKEEKEQNSYTFTIEKEDHTLGNMLTDQLLQEPRVQFAGYRIEHPTKDIIHIRVKVSIFESNPYTLIKSPVAELIRNVDSLTEQFKAQVR